MRESRSECRLATNWVHITNEEIGETDRIRWQIAILWKFLKRHLKLDQLMPKNLNGVTMQIYRVLIVYLILELMEILVL